MRLALLMSLASPWSREIALSLSALGNEIHVVDFDASAEPPNNYLSSTDQFQSQSIASFYTQVEGVHLIHSRFSAGLRYIVEASKLRAILKSISAEILVALYGSGYAMLAYMSRFRPYAVYTVGSDILLTNRIKQSMIRLALNNAVRVFANGRYLAEKTREIATAAQVIPLYIGIDTAKFRISTPMDTPIKIVCTRGFLPVYNNEYLIQGLSLLSDTAPAHTTTFISKGPTLNQVRALADNLLTSEKRPNVYFLNGATEDELIRTLQNSHIYVSLSRSEGTSISLLEALACGLFPVVSDIPQNREWITPEDNNGILVPLDQPSALAQALYRAMIDKDLRMRSAQHNRRLIEERACRKKNMAH